MRPEEKNLAYLWDMLDAAKTVQSFVKDVKFHQYESDRKLQLAVERAIGDHWGGRAQCFKRFSNYSLEYPMEGIIGQRHMLAHDYGEIKQERMWLLVTERIPELIKMLEPLIPPQ